MSFHTPKLLMILVGWFLITITFSSSPVSCTPTGTKQANSCHEREHRGLLTFKAGLTDEGGHLSSWSDDDNPNCCDWKGVSCSNQTGHVLKLNLRSPFQFDDPEDSRFMLKGEVRSSLLELKYLEYLDLSQNDFNFSKIPHFLGSLENLRYLNLSSSSFAGIVPPHIGNLSNLRYLDLGSYYFDEYRRLEVESLQWIKGLSSLKHLNLDGVNLEKAGHDWLKAFNMLPSLLELQLSNCHLSSLPPVIYQSINLTSLSTFDLSFNNFNSSLTIPPWLFNLTNLVNLQCINCSLQAVIPNEIGMLVKLQQLDLGHNSIRGLLPTSLGNLRNLVTLNLRYNYGIEGRIPATFGQLCGLQELGLGGNKLEGEINDFIDGLARCSNNQLDSLYLWGNSLRGSIPTTVGNLTHLKTLDLGDNQMNGTIAGSIGQLSELEELYLSRNPWQGGLLTETHFEKHTKLQTLYVGNVVMNVTQDWLPPFRTSIRDLVLDGAKMWSGEFPRWMVTLHQLEVLSLGDCGISDSIPTEFWKSCLNIFTLYLSNNAINIRMSFKNLELMLPLDHAGKLTYLYLANNSFSNDGVGGGGEILPNLAELAPSLEELDLSSNSISGEIPPYICQLSNLRLLSLHNNSLTGELTHHHWERFKQLWLVDLSSNKLVGKIPASLGSLPSLQNLYLNDNNLQGEIPAFINISWLQVVDLGGNKLTGNIPPSLAANNSRLNFLKLRRNMLTGTIPEEFCLLSKLQNLDLAHNRFEGIIPQCLGHLGSPDGRYVNVRDDGIVMVTKGREYRYPASILGFVQLVDLSHNNLSGKVPESLMNLTAMQTLNLSMNRLTGEIPSNIGALYNLESLDLSQNQLSGAIPLSISNISFLSYLNLSHNNLSGRIPSSRQLQTLDEPSRYDHNPLLCGLPLPTKCPGDSTPKSHQEEGGVQEKVEHGKRRFDLEEWGFILSLVLGFFVGFWGVCGSLVLKASWRQAYFGYLAGVKDKVIVIVVVNVARLRRKMGDIRMTT